MGCVFKRRKNWFIDYYYKGKRIKKKVCPSKRLAELALADVEVKIAKGEYLGIYEEKKILFRDFAHKYLEYARANKANSTYQREEGIIQGHLIPSFEGYLFEITSEKIERYKGKRLGEGANPATVNKEFSSIRCMLNKAREWGYLKENPARGVKILKEPPGRLRYLELEEIETLLKACPDWLRPIVVVAIHSTSGFMT